MIDARARKSGRVLMRLSAFPDCAPVCLTRLTPDGLPAAGGRNAGGVQDSRRHQCTRHPDPAGPRRKGDLVREWWREDGGHGGPDSVTTCVNSASYLGVTAPRGSRRVRLSALGLSHAVISRVHARSARAAPVTLSLWHALRRSYCASAVQSAATGPHETLRHHLLAYTCSYRGIRYDRHPLLGAAGIRSGRCRLRQNEGFL